MLPTDSTLCPLESFDNSDVKLSDFTVIFLAGISPLRPGLWWKINIKMISKTPWPESASELYRPRYRHLSEKLVQTFGDRGCHVVCEWISMAVFSLF
jgi:hypothetical protein